MRLLITALLGLALVTNACGRSTPDLPPISEFPAPGDPPKIVLKQAGQGVTTLAFAPTAGQKDEVAMVMDMDMSVSMMGQSMNMVMGIDSDLINTIDEVKDDKSFVEKSLIANAKVTVGGDAAAAMGGQTSQISDMMNGQTTVVTMDPRGRVISMEMPDNPVMKQFGGGFDSALKGSGVSFPEQPVGVGATWQTLSRIDLMGINMRFVAEYELLSLEGKQGKASIRMRGGLNDGESGKLDAMPGAELSAMSFEATGTIAFDLDHPGRSAIDLEMKMGAEIKAADEKGSIDLKMKMKLDPK